MSALLCLFAIGFLITALLAAIHVVLAHITVYLLAVFLLFFLNVIKNIAELWLRKFKNRSVIGA